MKFSFVIPTMNSDLYLNDCLKSLDAQTYKNIEVIIVDKNSVDNTHDIIKKFTNLNIKIFEQVDSSPEKAVALGFKKSTGATEHVPKHAQNPFEPTKTQPNNQSANHPSEDR